jgi:hypothetical protein
MLKSKDINKIAELKNDYTQEWVEPELMGSGTTYSHIVFQKVIQKNNYLSRVGIYGWF